MRAADFFISSKDLWTLIGGPGAPRIVDVRKPDALESSPGMLPTAAWRDPLATGDWMASLDRHAAVILACKEGHERSQVAAACLRERGFNASVLAGGYKAWTEAGLPLVAKAALDIFVPKRPSVWVTRRRPKIDASPARG
jgi:rhodanese-related sulfurtransferase